MPKCEHTPCSTEGPLVSALPNTNSKNQISWAGQSECANKLWNVTIVVESRTLIRQCFEQAVLPFGRQVISFQDIGKLIASQVDSSCAVTLLCGSNLNKKVEDDVALFKELHGNSKIVLLVDKPEVDHAIRALEIGFRGYIPTSTSLTVLDEALRLVAAGGEYIPAESLIAARRLDSETQVRRNDIEHVFTSRQIAVIEAIRRGKANKIIAYELNMCESTVKVHIRNIMKKLKARNRTHVAFLANEMLNGERSNDVYL